jgi:glyoxylase-like metal-dependent hydrolase (beta-lactamase superfamily II)
MYRVAPLGLATCLCAAVACHQSAPPGPPRQTVYQPFAVRFATLPGFPLRSLIAGVDSSRHLDIAMMIWALRAPNGKTILIDAGFHREKFITQWKPRDYRTPSEALRLAGVDPQSVTDIILSHIHWDHADGVDLFPAARVWLQAEEFEYYVGPVGEALHQGIDRDVSAMLRRAFDAGHVRLAHPDEEILPGIRVYTGGKHTYASQFAGVRTPSGTVVFASDNAYLFENLERHVPIAQTLDAEANLRAQGRMFEVASAPGLIIPGHDPAVFTRFPSVKEGVAAIR